MMIRRCYLVSLYFLSEVAFDIHHWLYGVASREVVKARTMAFQYRSWVHTKEVIDLVQEHIHDLSGVGNESSRLLHEERLQLWRLEEQLRPKVVDNETGAA